MRPGLRLFFLAFGAFFLAASAWSFACPLGSPPDEPAHLIRAASLVRGQLVGHSLPGATKAEGSVVVVQVPEVFASLANDVGCFKRDPKVPAGCQAPLVPSPQDQSVESYVGRYPPLYYAVTGLPTLALVSVDGVYGARLVSAAMCAAMLALAMVSAGRLPGRPLLPVGVALAATPMVIYLGGELNPSGFEAACGVAAFAGTVVVAGLPVEEIRNSDLARLGVPSFCLVMVRALSPVWVLVALAALGVLRGWPGTVALLRSGAVRLWAALGALAGAFALAWDFGAGALRLQPGTGVPPGASDLTIAHLALDRLHLVAVSSIGIFGWLDTSSPYGVVTAWALGALALVVLAFVVGSTRQRVAVAGATLVWVVFTYVFILAMVPTHGLVGQGRDFLGLAAGIPIVSASCIAVERLPGSLRRLFPSLFVVLVVVFAAGQVVDFYGTLRRYTVGTSGPLDAFASISGGWEPPVAGPLLVAGFVCGIAGVVAICISMGRRSRRMHSPFPLHEATPPPVDVREGSSTHATGLIERR